MLKSFPVLPNQIWWLELGKYLCLRCHGGLLDEVVCKRVWKRSDKTSSQTPVNQRSHMHNCSALQNIKSYLNQKIHSCTAVLKGGTYL